MNNIDKYFSTADALNAAKLFIDLGALRQNYQKLRGLSPTAICAGVVKSNAYGLGLEDVSRALAKAGCTHFFVAQPREAAQLRKVQPKAQIMVLNGLYEGAEDYYIEHNIIPVLNTGEEVEAWAAFADKKGKKLPALAHIDTGMNRLGMSAGECDDIFSNERFAQSLDILYLMSHLACADRPDDEHNRAQLKCFQDVMAKHPKSRASLANSAGIFLGADYHFDMTRPGCALYGGKSTDLAEAEMSPVVHLRSKFLQIRHVAKGEAVGYGATWVANRESVVGILPIGYGDGFARLHGSPTGELRGQVYVSGKKIPIIGRVSMDLMAVDLTELAQSSALRNMSVEILGQNITIDELAESAQTIGYEVLTNLGSRYARHYEG
jgi:alanine racemase